MNLVVQFDGVADFLAMGGHGIYVWSAYLIAAGVVLFTVFWPLWRRRRFFVLQRGRLRRAAADGRAAGGVHRTPE